METQSTWWMQLMQISWLHQKMEVKLSRPVDKASSRVFATVSAKQKRIESLVTKQRQSSVPPVAGWLGDQAELPRSRYSQGGGFHGGSDDRRQLRLRWKHLHCAWVEVWERWFWQPLSLLVIQSPWCSHRLFLLFFWPTTCQWLPPTQRQFFFIREKRLFRFLPPKKEKELLRWFFSSSLCNLWMR